MEQPEEELFVLRLTVEHLLSKGAWPTLAELHRPIHRELRETVDVGKVAQRVAPHPFISGYSDLNDIFAPRLETLARVPESRPILDGALAVIKHARMKYMSSTGDGEVVVTEREVRYEVGLSPEVVAVVGMLLDRVPWITNGGGSGQEGWYFWISDHVTQWKGVESRQDLIARLEAIARRQRQEYAAMSEAKAEMVRGTRSVKAVLVEQSPASPHWYERPWARGVAWMLGIALTVLTIFLGLRQL